MANAISPFGFQQFGRQEGGSPTAGFTAYKIDGTTATAIGYGDPVALTAGNVTALTDDGTSPNILGIFYGCTYVDLSTQRTIWNNQWPGAGSNLVIPNPAGGTLPTPVTAYVCDDPAQLYIGQAITGLTITPDLVGTSVGFSGGGAPGLFGFSMAAIGSTGTAFRVVGLLSDFVSPSSLTNGTDNTTAGNIAVVAPNQFLRRVLAAAAA